MSVIIPPAIAQAQDSVRHTIKAALYANDRLAEGDYAEALQCLRVARARMATVIDRLDRALATTVRPKNHARVMRDSEIDRAIEDAEERRRYA